MRKQLMVGTALAAATMLVAGGALAADKKMMKPSISVNGYYESVVGGILDEDVQNLKTVQTYVDDSGTVVLGSGTSTSSDASNPTSALDTRTDAEIYFNGRATLDNGVKIHAHVQLEAQYTHSDGDPIDEHFISVAGGFGKIILGGTEGAGAQMLTGFGGSWATGVGENLNFDNAWVPDASGKFNTVRYARLAYGDSEKITYISPKFGGFSVGLTYEPRVKNEDDNSRVNADADRHNAWHMAASYSGKFGDVGFGAGVGMFAAQGANKVQKGKSGSIAPNPDYDSTAGDSLTNLPYVVNLDKDTDHTEDMGAWIAAGRIDFGGGFRLAAAYKRTTDPMPDRGYVADVGVRFVSGANSFSLTGSRGEMDDSDAQHTAVMGSYARALGPGVKVHANVLWSDSESAKTSKAELAGADPAADDTVTTTWKENSGVALISGIKVTF